MIPSPHSFLLQEVREGWNVYRPTHRYFKYPNGSVAFQYALSNFIPRPQPLPRFKERTAARRVSADTSPTPQLDKHISEWRTGQRKLTIELNSP